MTKTTNNRQTLNARQEAFCQKIASGSTQFEAYTSAGYKAATRAVADTEASKLLRYPKVAARVKELQRQNALAAQVTVASVTEMYLEIYRGALAAKEYAPATAAATGIARLHGLIVCPLSHSWACQPEPLSPIDTLAGGHFNKERVI